MVWLNIALHAKVLAAVRAPYPIFGHVLGSLRGQRLALVVFLASDYLPWEQLHDIPALATDEVWVEFYNLHGLCFFNLLLFIIIQILIELESLKHLLAPRAANVIVLGAFLDGVLLETFNVDLVEALRRLDEGLAACLLLSLSNLLFAKSTSFFVSFMLDLLIVSLGSHSLFLTQKIVEVFIGVDHYSLVGISPLRIDHLHISGLLHLTGWAAVATNVKYLTQFLDFVVTGHCTFFVFHDARDDLRKLGKAFFLHSVALERVGFNLL